MKTGGGTAALNCEAPDPKMDSLSRDDDEEEETTLSWTSSLQSLSPDNPLYQSKQQQNSKQQLQQQLRPAAPNGSSAACALLSSPITTTTTTLLSPKFKPPSAAVLQGLHNNPGSSASAAVELLDASQPPPQPPLNTPSSVRAASPLVGNKKSQVDELYEFHEQQQQHELLPPPTLPYDVDEDGEPIVDELLLQSLTALPYQEDHHHDLDDDEDDPVMLESSSSHEDELGMLVGDQNETSAAAAALPMDDSAMQHAQHSTSFLPPASPAHNLGASLWNSSPARAVVPPSPDRSIGSSRNDEPTSFACFDDHPFSGDEHDDNELNELTPSLLRTHHGRKPSTIVEDPFADPFEIVTTSEKQQQHNDIGQSQQPPLNMSQLSDLAEETLSSSNTTGGGLRYRHSSSNSTSSLNSSNSGAGATAATGLLRYSHQLQNSKVAQSATATATTSTMDPLEFTPLYAATRLIRHLSKRVLPAQHRPHAGAATWIGFWALASVTCANYVLTPMRDAIALQVGVQHMPQLTLASTVLAVFSSVPIGWLFEAPDPGRRRLWKRMGLTRGETQGTSLALFYRLFAFILVSYAVGFQWLEYTRRNAAHDGQASSDVQVWFLNLTKIWASLGPVMFIAFFLVVHLMKLHCLSLIWGVSTEAMEYEEVARKTQQNNLQKVMPMESNKMRLKRLSLVGFGGTIGGILGSFLASSTAQTLRLPGLLLLAALLLEVSAELSIELGQIMKKHWEEQQQLFQSTNDLTSLDPSMKRSSSLGSMKRISSGNSLNRVKSTSDLGNKTPLSPGGSKASSSSGNLSAMSSAPPEKATTEDSFSQRMLRGITTILRSRLLMAIFTYNALYASTTVLLSFQRAALVANRNSSTTVQADTAFLANINMASSAAIFALQASGIGAYVAHRCGSRGTLALMPLIRLAGVIALAWWHRYSGGQPPNLLVFLVVDECCKIMNLAVAKPVRESLWRGLSNEARYEAKPIVDTLANRWGGGSAAFLVSFVDKTLDIFGVVAQDQSGGRNVFGFPPVLFLCVFIAGWWAVVSADLGLIRKNIDIELKKRQ